MFYNVAMKKNILVSLMITLLFVGCRDIPTKVERTATLNTHIYDKSYEKIVSNIQEVKARNGIVIAIITEGDSTISKMADHTLEIPAIDEKLMSLLSVIPLQLIAYHIALLRGCNVDQPRNLAKSVTVE